MPWCKKSGVWPAGEQWFTEAALETYIPMLNALRELKEKKIKTALTINITPILAESMADESRYIKLSPKLKRVVELDDLLGSLRVEILSQMLTPMTWWFSSTGSSDFSSMLSVQARKL